eukprot:6185344-Pleurochrysis_carterae.AAC.1
MSLQLIATHLINKCYLDASTPRQASLYVPGVPSTNSVSFEQTPIPIWTSVHNPGALDLAHEIQLAIPGVKIAGSFPKTNSGALKDQTCAASSAENETCDELLNASMGVFVLYLNHETFLGDVGRELVSQLRVLVRRRAPVVVAHELDPHKRGCELDR